MGQDNPIDNGIWVASPATWRRSPDFDGARDVVNGTLVFSIYGDCWQVEAEDPVQIGYSEINLRSTYPFNGNPNIFQRSLRVPDVYIPEMPSLDEMEGKIVAIAGGRPIGVLPQIGSASDVMIELAKSTGSKLVGYIGRPSLISRTVQGALREKISINDFYILRQTDWTAAMQAARDYLFNFVGRSPILEFETGVIYEYSSSPSWAIKDLNIRMNGCTWRNTVTGVGVNIDSGLIDRKFNISITGGYEGGPATSHGVYMRSVHHSEIDIEVRGCGTTSYAYYGVFLILTTIKAIASINRGAWFLGGKPLSGIVLEARGVYEGVTACYFPKPIIEGVGAHGILLTDADQCQFIGDTSEGNGGANIECAFESQHNTFIGVYLEKTGSGQGFIDRGRWNKWQDVYNDALCTITGTAINYQIIGGTVNGISDSGTSTFLSRVVYGLNGGTNTKIGAAVTSQQSIDTYRHVTGTYNAKNLNGLQFAGGSVIKKHLSLRISTNAWTNPTTVPGVVEEIFTLTGAVAGDTVTMGSTSAISSNYILSAIVSANDTVKVRAHQLTGATASPFPSGTAITVDVWGH